MITFRDYSDWEIIIQNAIKENDMATFKDYAEDEKRIREMATVSGELSIPKSNISDMSRWLPKGTKIEETKLGDTESFNKWKENMLKKEINEMNELYKTPESEPKHPDYYKGSNKDGKAIEVFDIIDQFVDGDFYLGNVLKYVCRAGKKSKETKRRDLEKASHYIKEAIKRI